MINYIQNNSELLLGSILLIFGAFILGYHKRDSEVREQNIMFDKEVYKNIKLVRENKYLRKRLGLDNLTKDMGGE